MALPLAGFALPWDDATAPDPIEALTAARAQHGDSFRVLSGGDGYVFVFSPASLQQFYALPERVASKGVADLRMLGRKLPESFFFARRTFPHDHFGASDVETYLGALDHAIAVQFREVGDCTIDLFEFARALGHRLALTCWIGRVAAEPAAFEPLRADLDEIDAAEVFVRPANAANQEWHQRVAEALDRATDRIATLVPDADGFAPAIAERWADVDGANARARGVAGDIILLHTATMTNLFAALGWTIGLALLDDSTHRAIRANEPGVIEAATLEAIRIGQHSIMTRAVLQAFTLDGADEPVVMEPEQLLATMAPITNRVAGTDLARYDPRRWDGRRLTTVVDVPEQVVTFGHGAHRCPATRFSLSAIGRTVRFLFDRYELHAGFGEIRPLAGQIGGMARAATPCPVTLAVRTGHHS